MPYRVRMDELRYLRGYGERVLSQVRALIDAGRLGEVLRNRYSAGHQVRDDKALFEYVVAIKDRYMRKSDPLNKVVYDNKLHVVQHALGTHTAVSRVHGGRLKAAREIRIATLFRDAPGEFLEMIAVHELAHLKHRDHDKAFYQLCTHMSPDYHQREFDLRLYLTQLELAAQKPAAGAADQAAKG
ncbi:M48 family metallopeptidase [Lysobacter sp. BMK333-48F3]|uniref:M48 family metallopeptidase n=1 Tax=Lysobacter sp. BMK333-48F3 TaxID=2867962 RepID=UPI002104A623|nr:M48 family metallopeptidase [Lysobacter sp. BMK333-48F3]